jgi:hypothetical protein
MIKKAIAEQLREMILSFVPGVQEKMSYKIPFYHYFGIFCYINETKEGIDLGFCRGKELLMVLPQLEQRNRAMIASILICTKKEIQTKRVQEAIVTAANWQEEAYRNKIPMLKRTKKKKPTKK